MTKSLTKWDKITWLTVAFAALVGFLIVLHYWPDEQEIIESDADLSFAAIAEPNKIEIISETSGDYVPNMIFAYESNEIKTLISLEEYEENRPKFEVITEIPCGIACPECGEEIIN